MHSKRPTSYFSSYPSISPLSVTQLGGSLSIYLQLAIPALYRALERGEPVKDSFTYQSYLRNARDLQNGHADRIMEWSVTQPFATKENGGFDL